MKPATPIPPDCVNCRSRLAGEAPLTYSPALSVHASRVRRNDRRKYQQNR